MLHLVAVIPLGKLTKSTMCMLALANMLTTYFEILKLFFLASKHVHIIKMH